MRRSDHPSRPSAMTCCFFSSLKTLLTLTEGNPHVMLNVLGSTPLAGFQVILIGRFWVIPEANCKTETELYDSGSGVPICIKCADEHDAKRKPPNAYQQVRTSLLQDIA